MHTRGITAYPSTAFWAGTMCLVGLVAFFCTTADAQDTAPHTPEGMARCEHPQHIAGPLPSGAGEVIRYVVNVDGLNLGTIDFKVERQGSYEGLPVLEYRSLFKLDALVAAFVPVEGRAVALVGVGQTWPKVARNQYKLERDEIEEKATYAADGCSVQSTRVKGGETKADKRVFPGPVQDFVTGFYLLRRLPATLSGCAIVYGNQRAFTIWVRPLGQEQVKTPVGVKMADLFELKYATDKSTKPVVGRVWLGLDAERLPYRAEIDGAHHLEATIHLYQMGKKVAAK